MSKKLSTAIALLCVLALSASAQQQYLVSMTGEVITIKKGETASKAAARAGILTKVQAECPTSVVVGESQASTTNFGWNRGDVYMQRLVAPVAGTIDTIFWLSEGLVDPPDSSCSVRIFKSNITDADPGPVWDGTTVAQHWGYYNYAADPFVRKTAAYIDEPGMTPAEQVWVPDPNLAGSFDPNGEELWGLGGFITTWHTGRTINAVATADLGSPTVAAGDAFNVAIRVPPADAAGGRTEANVAAWALPTNPYMFKFYYFPRSSEGTQGWWARAYLGRIWVVVTAQGNLPPIIGSVTALGNTVSTDPQTVVATAFDCNAENASDTAVVSGALFYATDGGAYASVPMTLGASGWSGDIPGQAAGTDVQYYVEVTDNKGLTESSTPSTYGVFDLNRAGYQTSYPTYSYVDLTSTPAILATSFFSYTRPDTNFDDGTAGPFDMGGDFTFFGTPYRYAWIGANGAVGFSATQAETVDVNVAGFASTFAPPYATAPVPVAFGWWNDWAPYGSGTGDIKYKAEGTQFIVEWNAVGNFVGNGTSTFQMVLDRSDNSVTVQFKEVGTDDMESQGMTGLQADETTKWTVLNFLGTPAETVPANNKAIKMTYLGTDVQPGEGVPLVYALNQNYPNPFNPSTKISYSIAQSGLVTLKVYDVLGRQVMSLVNETKQAGSHTVDFDASRLANGAYYYKLQAGSFSQVKSMMLLK